MPKVRGKHMSQIRTFNVLTLTMILFLAGCFGMGDSAEAADDHEHTPNAAPVLHAELILDDNNDDLDYPLANCSQTACNISVYHAAVDPDGDLLELGYDFDLDGTIDYQLTNYRGITDLLVPISEFIQTTVPIDEVIIQTSDCVSGQQLVVTETTTVTSMLSTIAFIAVDSNDAASALLLTSEEVYDISTISANSTQACVESTWSFSHRDAAGDMSDQGMDALVHVQMTSGDALSWHRVKVSIVVDGGASKLCVEGGEGWDSDCTWDKDGDNTWDVADEITITEGGDDLCSGEAPCSVVVTLTKIGVGEEADMVIASITATAENN